MNEKIDWKFLITDTRARIYLLWAVLTLIGFTTAHYSRNDIGINSFWVVLSILGLGYMYKVMPLRIKSAQRVLQAWLVPIVIGSVVSVSAFYVAALQGLIPYLGAFWLFVMATSYIMNGFVDSPATWYWVAATLNVAAGLAIIFVPELQITQWLIAAVVSTWSLLNLWLFRP